MVTQNYDPRLVDVNMAEAPETTSFMYIGRLAVEEWTFLSAEKRQRNGYIKPDVPYYHVAVQPLSYRISDGGMEGDGLEHTYVAIKSAQGELTPKNSGRGEMVAAFTKLGFARNTVKDLETSKAVGKVFQFKRYNRMYTRAGAEPIRGELMNVPVDIKPDDWQPAPGTNVPEYSRGPRNTVTASEGIVSGGVARPIGVSMSKVAEELANASTPATESAVRTFILDRTDLAQGDVLDLALGQGLMAKLETDGLISTSTGVIAKV